MEKISELINVLLSVLKNPAIKIGTAASIFYFIYPYINQIIVLIITKDKDNIVADYDFKNKRYTFKKKNKL